MKFLQLYLFSLIIFFFTNCRKNKTSSCPQQNYYHISNLINQFNFKKNSYWLLKNSTTNIKDTLKVYYSSGVVINTLNGGSKECPDGDKREGYHVSVEHKFFANTSSGFDFVGGNEGISTSYYKYCTCNQISFFEKNSGDSISFNNNSNWSKIEVIYPAIVINGHTYTNVYQMVYYPDLYDFKRIWWCPGIGFVKFEHLNSVTNQTEYWELDSYNVQLY